VKATARSIFEAAVQAVEPEAAVRRFVQRQGTALVVDRQSYRLQDFDGVTVVGTGKAAAPMAAALEGVLGQFLRAGLVTVKYGHGQPLRVVRIQEAGHPVPDGNGQKGASAILDLVKPLGARDLLFCLLSGGGSALLPCPADGLTLEDKQQATRQLLACGADIEEMNAVRKHLSAIKGGQLARAAAPATVISLVLSDVIGDRLDVIASGPAVPDKSTFGEAAGIIDRYGLWATLPPAVVRRLRDGVAGKVPDTPKPGDPAFARTQTVIVGSNTLAIQAAAARARELGYHTLILSSFMEGETREIARAHAAVAREIHHSGNPVPVPACVLSGGETTVTLRGDGKGGRNQEFALAAAQDIAGLPDTLILSAGTDGTDGPTDAAGAFADGTTVARGLEHGLDAGDCLRRNDSYHFFERLGDLLVTGPTRTNVMDVRILLVGHPR